MSATPVFSLLIEALLKLGLPSDRFVVFGSAPLALRGIRDVTDLDLVLAPDLWQQVAYGRDAVLLPTGVWSCRLAASIEALDGWAPWPGSVESVETLIANAERWFALRFVPLSVVREWKTSSSRMKDRLDLALIDAYLAALRGGEVSASR